MPLKPQNVSTAADDLAELIVREKEIAFKDAAKKLKVPVSTIEAWATFLEEDGVLSIKYKLTTPYLTVPTAKKEKVKKQTTNKDKLFLYKVKEAEIRSDFDKTSEILDTVASKASEGDFAMLESLQTEAMDKLRKVIDFLMSGPNVSPQRKVELADDVSAIEERIQQAAELMKQKKFDEANITYSESGHKMNELLQKVQRQFEEKPLQNDGKNITELFEKTYALLDEGKADEAEQNYERVRRMFAALSSKFSTEKSNIQENIIKLNRDLAVRTSKIRANQVSESTIKINELVKLADNAVRKKKFDESVAYYFEIKKLFENLPAGFSKEKYALKGSILKVFAKISKESESQLKSKFSFTHKEIEHLLKEFDKLFCANDLQSALPVYKQISQAYAKLPAGFIKEKFYLHKQIIVAYNKLSQRIELSAESVMSLRSSKLLELLSVMKKQVADGNLVQAKQTYALVNNVFAKLPGGFIEQKTELQEKIIDLYEDLVAKKDHKKTLSFNDALQDIQKMLDETKNAVNERDYAQAYCLYRRMKTAYTKLPPIDMELRQKMRNKILLAYRGVLILRNEQEPSDIKIPPLLKLNPNNIHEKIDYLKTFSKAKVRKPIVH